MSTILESLATFEANEPHICVWCLHCGIVVTDGLWGYVCLRRGHGRNVTKRMKGAIVPFPSVAEGVRLSVQCVGADERHECFVPTPVASARMKVLDAMGLLEGVKP